MLDKKNQIEGDLFTEITPQAQYVFVYRMFKGGKIEVLYDNSFGKINAKLFWGQKDIHALSHKKAFENNRITYYWFLTSDKTSFFESTLIPLEDNLGQVESLFCMIKYLEGVFMERQKNMFVADKVGESFVHLLMKVREEEKRQIACAFHDEIGSNAVVLNSLISILKEDLLEDKKEDALKSISDLEEVVQNITQRMRRIIISIRPPQLKEIGLVSAIKDLIDSIESSSNIKFHFDCDMNENTNLSEEVKIVLYRSVQEAINNVFKHAKAKNIWISLKEENTSILLKIKDDGIGYKETKSSSVKKMGLLGMKESAVYIGGSFDIKGKSGKGTLVSVRCPKISYIRKVI